MNRTVTLAVAVFAVVAVLGTPTGSPAPHATVTVTNIPILRFTPAVVTVDVKFGQTNTIVFTYDANEIAIPHQPRSDPHTGAFAQFEGACMSMGNNVILPGQTVALPITLTPQCLIAILGTQGVGFDGSLLIRYHCHIHVGMTGIVKLVPSP